MVSFQCPYCKHSQILREKSVKALKNKARIRRMCSNCRRWIRISIE